MASTLNVIGYPSKLLAVFAEGMMHAPMDWVVHSAADNEVAVDCDGAHLDQLLIENRIISPSNAPFPLINHAHCKCKILAVAAKIGLGGSRRHGSRSERGRVSCLWILLATKRSCKKENLDQGYRRDTSTIKLVW